jgi:hypothetical protein
MGSTTCAHLMAGSVVSTTSPSDCSRCPVPDILRANASEYLELHAEIRPGVLGIGRHVDVVAWCRKHDHEIEDPYVGCRACAAERPGFSLLLGDEEDT